MERRLGRSCETAAGVVGRLNLTMCGWLVWDVSSVERGVVVEPLDVSGSDVGMMDVSVTVLEPLSLASSSVKEGDGTER